MFKSLVTSSLPVLTLSAHRHNVLNAAMIDDISKMMEREKWTCHVCGTQMHGMMEVDHLKGHKPSAKSGILPICQFCHDRKHPIWAASRGRFSILHAPDMSYEEISQLTWAFILHDRDEGFTVDMKRLDRDLKARREDAFDALGHSNIESIFESILAIRDAQGEDATLDLMEEIDAHLKIVPSALFAESRDLRVWGPGGFNALAEGWERRAVPNGLPAMDVMKTAGEALKARL